MLGHLYASLFRFCLMWTVHVYKQLSVQHHCAKKGPESVFALAVGFIFNVRYTLPHYFSLWTLIVAYLLLIHCSFRECCNVCSSTDLSNLLQSLEWVWRLPRNGTGWVYELWKRWRLTRPWSCQKCRKQVR